MDGNDFADLKRDVQVRSVRLFVLTYVMSPRFGYTVIRNARIEIVSKYQSRMVDARIEIVSKYQSPMVYTVRSVVVRTHRMCVMWYRPSVPR
eukprot:COSAG05_NODE_3321_length_2150_cov_1.577279_1_plen_92_part_00